jgi:hypothetical protein
MLLAVVILAPAATEAQEKPFKVTGEGVAPLGLPLPGQPPRPHSIVGNATHLGRHDGDGFVETDTADPEFDSNGNLIGFTGEFGSGIDDDGNPMPFEFRGANGDKLVCMYGRTAFGASEPGTFHLTIVGVTPEGALIVEALFIAEFVPQSNLCTGKFAGVTGSWIMIAQTESFVLGSTDPIFYSWEGKGTLTFAKKGGKK